MTKIKVKRGDKVLVIAGKDKGKEGKILFVDRKANRVVVEGVGMISRHTKQKNRRDGKAAGIVHREAPIHASNVMFLFNGKPTKIGFIVNTVEKDGKTIKTKQRVARSTGEVID